MTKENLNNGFIEARKCINSWAQIEIHLPDDYNPHNKRFLRDYFRAQLRVAQGKPVKAKRIFQGLVKRTGYNEFEETNEPYLAAVDLAVKGHTRWQSAPAFRVN